MVDNSELGSSESMGPENWDSMEAWDAYFAGTPNSETVLRIWRDVYGDDYPEGVEPTSFVTMTDLVRIAQELSIGSGDTLVDLGCGRGGPGLWVARETGADLIGIDYSPQGVEWARRRACDFGREGHAQFFVADICATRLQDSSCQGAMSVDMLWNVPDKGAALREIARILQPGARFALTNWESTEPDAIDYQVLFQDTGFVVEACDEKPDWERRQRAVYERILAEQTALIEEMGEAAVRPVLNEAKESPSELSHFRHLFMIGRRV